MFKLFNKKEEEKSFIVNEINVGNNVCLESWFNKDTGAYCFSIKNGEKTVDGKTGFIGFCKVCGEPYFNRNTLNLCENCTNELKKQLEVVAKQTLSQ